MSFKAANYPLSKEQKALIEETLEEIGIENLQSSMIKVLLTADNRRLPAKDRSNISKLMNGLLLVSNQHV